MALLSSSLPQSSNFQLKISNSQNPEESFTRLCKLPAFKSENSFSSSFGKIQTSQALPSYISNPRNSELKTSAGRKPNSQKTSTSEKSTTAISNAKSTRKSANTSEDELESGESVSDSGHNSSSAINIAKLASRVSAKLDLPPGVTPHFVFNVITSTLNEIAEAVAHGERVRLFKFGIFEQRQRTYTSPKFLEKGDVDENAKKEDSAKKEKLVVLRPFFSASNSFKNLVKQRNEKDE